MLEAMRKDIDQDLANSTKPYEKIKLFNTMIKKYKHDFAEEHEKEIEELTQQFGGKIIK
jgi:hypothetical protein